MGSTYHSLHYHVVFSTKERRPFIQAAWRSRLHAYLGGTVRSLGGVAEVIGGVADHVHCLLGLKTTHCVADVIRDLKKESSAWAAEKFARNFAWQESYSVFTVSATHLGAFRKYIANQETHHRRTDFATELRRLLERNGVSFDPKYLS